ncbi:MAG: threonine synthase [Proteobacteria bacterium]|nr:threonine synthase [Pseudomonadota bacterium]
MFYTSTRKNAPAVRASDAIMQGLAPDGGLYIPQSFPSLSALPYGEISSYPELAFEVLAPFFEEDPLLELLPEICVDAFNFPVSLHPLGEQQMVLELFGGPTAAFKDFGARFLAASMEQILRQRGEQLTILVATSGDTGGAVAAAFAGKERIRVKVLFPKGRVSDRQKQQLTCWGGNIEAYEVDGSFDDCQRMVKEAFMDKGLSMAHNLSSANSINLGRLLPQSVYYVYASQVFEKAFGAKPTIIIPSGNVGNATAAYWAHTMGAPIDRIVLALNANRTIADYLASGEYEGRSSVQTLANAMDVGDPSNMERLFALYPTIEEMRAMLTAYSVDDEQIRHTIGEVYKESGYILCPHTATAERVRRDYFADKPSIIVATAHPAKFEQTVEPLVGKSIDIPEQLAALLDKPTEYRSIGPDYRALFA